MKDDSIYVYPNDVVTIICTVTKSIGDSYLISISYLCTDQSTDCIKPFDKKDDEGDYSNYYYQASMFIGGDDEVLLVGPKEYLSL